MTLLTASSAAFCIQNRQLLEETQARIALGWRIRNGWIGIRGGSSSFADHGAPHWPLDALQRLVRDKIERGALFILPEHNYWAGPATGQQCKVCTQIIFPAV